MTAGTARLPDYLGHVQQAIERIERYTAGMDEGAFRTDALVQDAVIRNFEVIGEACRNIRAAGLRGTTGPRQRRERGQAQVWLHARRRRRHPLHPVRVSASGPRPAHRWPAPLPLDCAL